MKDNSLEEEVLAKRAKLKTLQDKMELNNVSHPLGRKRSNYCGRKTNN